MSVLSDFLKLGDEIRSMPVSHVWDGYHGTVFLELGELTERIRDDGSIGNPNGEVSICFQWCWMLFKGEELICESEDGEDVWLPILKALVGETVASLTLVDDPPEIELLFKAGADLCSIADDGVNPDWFIIDKRVDGYSGFEVKNGKLCY